MPVDEILSVAATIVMLTSMAVLCLVMAYPFALACITASGRRRLARRTQAEKARSLPADRDLPTVCVQIPTFNEAAVVGRIVEACGRLDWPAHRLEIQLLDDSTDACRERGAAAIERLRARGLNASMRHRTDRTGFKAGALQAGLEATDAEFIAIFDADFLPPPDFLRRIMPSMLADERIAIGQARWDHINPTENALTRAQSLGLDIFFRVEQPARMLAGLPMTFHGTCGVWRAAAIRDAGGWQSDTLAEDLDLSYRARLKGWRTVYRPDIAVPGELPETIIGWRTQQFRWTKGPMQAARKLLPAIWRSDWRFVDKTSASLHATQSVVYPAAVAILLAAPLVAMLGSDTPLLLYIAGNATLCFTMIARLAAGAFVAAGSEEGALAGLNKRPPILMTLYSALSVNNTRGVVEALTGRHSAFERTPKTGGATKAAPPEGATVPAKRPTRTTGPIGLGELALAGWGIAAVSQMPLSAAAFILLPAFWLSVVGGTLAAARIVSALEQVRSRLRSFGNTRTAP